MNVKAPPLIFLNEKCIFTKNKIKKKGTMEHTTVFHTQQSPLRLFHPVKYSAPSIVWMFLATSLLTD